MDTLLLCGGVLFLFLSGTAAFVTRRVTAIACSFALSAVSAIAGIAVSGARPAAVPVAGVLYFATRLRLEALARREQQPELPPQHRARLRRSSALLGAAVAFELAVALPIGLILGWPWAVGLVVLALLALPTALRQRARASA